MFGNAIRHIFSGHLFSCSVPTSKQMGSYFDVVYPRPHIGWGWVPPPPHPIVVTPIPYTDMPRMSEDPHCQTPIAIPGHPVTHDHPQLATYVCLNCPHPPTPLGGAWGGGWVGTRNSKTGGPKKKSKPFKTHSLTHSCSKCQVRSHAVHKSSLPAIPKSPAIRISVSPSRSIR